MTPETDDSGLDRILAELIAREPIFHRPEHGSTRADFERMTHPDFWEVGASGRRYDRAFVLDELERRQTCPHPDIWETSGFALRRLCPDTFLLTYDLLQDGTRHTRRATLWKQTSAGWQILYHQGTLIQGAAPD